MVRIAEALLEREVLDAQEVKLLLEGKPLPKPVVTKPPTEEPTETQRVLKPVRNSDKPLAEGEKPATA